MEPEPVVEEVAVEESAAEPPPAEPEEPAPEEPMKEEEPVFRLPDDPGVDPAEEPPKRFRLF